MRIRARLLVSTSLLIFIAIGAIVIVVNHFEGRSILEDRKRTALDLVYVLAHSSVQAIVADDYVVLQEILDSVHSKKDILHAMILDNDCRILVHDETRRIGQQADDAASREAVQAMTERAIQSEQADGVPVWDVSVPIMIMNRKVGMARIIFSLENARREIARTRNTVLGIGGLAFLCTVFLSSFLAGLMVKPIHRLVNASRRIGRGDLSHRVGIESNDEIGELAGSFDQMADDLAERDRRLEDKMAQLSELSSYNENILQSMSSGVITVDLRGFVETFNRSAARITGLPEQEVKGKDLRTMTSFDPAIRELILSTLASHKERQSCETRYPNHQGQELTLQVTTLLLRNAENQAIGVLTVFNDLTEMKKLEEDMRRAERLAALGTTAASIAHEIRTPLTSLSTFAELLPTKYHEQKFRDRFQAVVPAQVDRLTNLVDDLLDFSRIETLSFQETQINSTVREAVDLLREKAAESRVRIDLDMAPDLPMIMADADHLSQVFLNIIQNALQAMPEGGTLKIATHTDHGTLQPMDSGRSLSEGEFIQVSFSDSGIGIAEENMARLFEPFFSTRSKGTGLGLAVSYRIIKDHEGSIQVQSKVGTGSTFTVSLPLRKRST